LPHFRLQPGRVPKRFNVGFFFSIVEVPPGFAPACLVPEKRAVFSLAPFKGLDLPFSLPFAFCFFHWGFFLGYDG